LVALVNCTTDGVPDSRDQLPLVDQSWRSTCEEDFWFGRSSRLEPSVTIKVDTAKRYLLRRRCFATGLASLDDHGASGAQCALELGVQ